MNIIEPRVEIMHMPDPDFILRHIELAGRTCYKSEDKIKDGSAESLIKALIRSGHTSVLEHVSITVRFIVDRGISHELVRHRAGTAFSQESSRYANYSNDKFGNEITVIRPLFWRPGDDEYGEWLEAMNNAEISYLNLLFIKSNPQEARGVLPTSTKTEVVTTLNLRACRHFFNLRCAKASHPQIRQVSLPLLAYFFGKIPVLFDDLHRDFCEDILKFNDMSPVEILECFT